MSGDHSCSSFRSDHDIHTCRIIHYESHSVEISQQAVSILRNLACCSSIESSGPTASNPDADIVIHGIGEESLLDLLETQLMTQVDAISKEVNKSFLLQFELNFYCADAHYLHVSDAVSCCQSCNRGRCQQDAYSTPPELAQYHYPVSCTAQTFDVVHHT